MTSIVRRPGEGDRNCPQTTFAGPRCNNREIEGLVYCLQHMPAEYLEEAEEITGTRRCRTGLGTPEECHNYAVDGSSPPTCGLHLGGVNRQRAAVNVVENRLATNLARILAEGGEKLLNPPPVDDPLAEMLDLAGEIKAGKELLREMVASLFATASYRWSSKQVGEQVRAELLLYERAVERFAKILIDISKMKIDERLAGIRQQTADMMERALDAAIEEMHVSLEHRQPAKEAFRRHLQIVS